LRDKGDFPVKIQKRAADSIYNGDKTSTFDDARFDVQAHRLFL
jgi:hypothetical protein